MYGGTAWAKEKAQNCCRMHECVAVGSRRSSRSESSDDFVGFSPRTRAHGRARKLACGFAVAGMMIIFIFFRIYAKNRKFPKKICRHSAKICTINEPRPDQFAFSVFRF